MRLNAVEWIAIVLVVIGGINWGLWGIFEFNLVSAVFGELTWVSRLIYILVGLAAVYFIIDALARQKPRHAAEHRPH